MEQPSFISSNISSKGITGMTNDSVFKIAKSVVPPPISIKATPASFLPDSIPHQRMLMVLMSILTIQFLNFGCIVLHFLWMMPVPQQREN
jgi:hypothetical protein